MKYTFNECRLLLFFEYYCTDYSIFKIFSKMKSKKSLILYNKTVDLLDLKYINEDLLYDEVNYMKELWSKLLKLNLSSDLPIMGGVIQKIIFYQTTKKDREHFCSYK